MELKDLEQGIREKVAGEFLNSLSPEAKEEILKSAVENSMKEIASSYKLKMFISDKLEVGAEAYLEEYLKDPDVQVKLQEQAREAVDVCLTAVTKSIASNLERTMKSQYHNFIPIKEE